MNAEQLEEANKIVNELSTEITEIVDKFREIKKKSSAIDATKNDSKNLTNFEYNTHVG